MVVWKALVHVVQGISTSVRRHPLLDGNLVDALLMAATFELGGEILVHDLASHVLIDEATGHHEHVGIVVLTDEMGDLRNPAQTGTDGLVLVERHVDALTRTADGNAGIDLTLFDATSQGMTEVGVVAGLFGISTIVLILITLLFEVFLYELF